VARRGRGARSAAAGATVGPGAARPAGPPVDEGEFERLKAWRWDRAEGKPAYTVATNAVLEEVLRRRPETTEDLIEIRGIGPALCEKHGESLLEAVRALDAPREADAALASGAAPT
ncbi:MAG TPA: HRDC domain-containing protein, partial [Solirubrobacteraceae bacterium]|nr:HRDC domain-containing protein [Solirubrobacteraceae bacterium]